MSKRGGWELWGSRFREAVADKELHLAVVAERLDKAESTVISLAKWSSKDKLSGLL